MSAKALMDIGMEGYAIGGLAVGEPKHKMVKIIAQLNPLLPRTKPRYLMGVGTPLDILYGIETASTCSTASCPRETQETAPFTPTTAKSISKERNLRKTKARLTSIATVIPAEHSAKPIYGTFTPVRKFCLSGSIPCII